ncbi:MAG: hypothetical protein RLZZ555_1221, partial [Pseudomonadota bacterium]
KIPVVYDRQQGGYRLEPGHSGRELPGLWLSAEELVALATLQHLLTELAPGLLGQKMAPLRERLSGLLHDMDLDSLGLAQRIRVVHAGKRRLPPRAFETVVSATLKRQRLRISHHNREKGETIEREVSPQQLVHYRDNWYLDAWCHLRDGLRSFAVDAISRCEALADKPSLDIDAEQLKAHTQAGYGIFSGESRAWARLRFSPLRARWVSGEQWHPEQKSEWLADGSYLLELPYSDDRELVGDILRQAGGCEVLEPPELRAHVVQALQEALRRYR